MPKPDKKKISDAKIEMNPIQPKEEEKILPDVKDKKQSKKKLKR